MDKLSRNIKEYYSSSPYKTDKEIASDLKGRIKTVCKPCWELKYCPYGYLVEDFPLPGIPKTMALEHIKYIQQCLDTKKLGDGSDLDKKREKIFKLEVEQFDEKDYDDGPFNLENEMSCRIYGHICPAYFVSEPFTETKSIRKNERNISFSTKIRVARRDNYKCQVCGKPLLETEMEFDHIIPFSKGGSSEEQNIRLTCTKCNREKSNKVFDVIKDLREFYEVTLKDEKKAIKRIDNKQITDEKIVDQLLDEFEKKLKN